MAKHILWGLVTLALLCVGIGCENFAAYPNITADQWGGATITDIIRVKMETTENTSRVRLILLSESDPTRARPFTVKTYPGGVFVVLDVAEDQKPFVKLSEISDFSNGWCYAKTAAIHLHSYDELY